MSASQQPEKPETIGPDDSSVTAESKQEVKQEVQLATPARLEEIFAKIRTLRIPSSGSEELSVLHALLAELLDLKNAFQGDYMRQLQDELVRSNASVAESESQDAMIQNEAELEERLKYRAKTVKQMAARVKFFDRKITPLVRYIDAMTQAAMDEVADLRDAGAEAEQG